jgi:hypothetical protein
MPAPAWILSAQFRCCRNLLSRFASILVAAYRRHTRVIGFLAALVSVVASALLLRAAPKGVVV